MGLVVKSCGTQSFIWQWFLIQREESILYIYYFLYSLHLSHRCTYLAKLSSYYRNGALQKHAFVGTLLDTSLSTSIWQKVIHGPFLVLNTL